MANTIKVTASEELFNAWDTLGKRLSALKLIVQNDQTIELKEWQDWVVEVREIQREMDEQVRRMSLHLFYKKPEVK